MNVSDDGPILDCLTGARLQCPSWRAQQFQAELQAAHAACARLEQVVLDQQDRMKKYEDQIEELRALLNVATK